MFSVASIGLAFCSLGGEVTTLAAERRSERVRTRAVRPRGHSGAGWRCGGVLVALSRLAAGKVRNRTGRCGLLVRPYPPRAASAP